MFSQPTICFLKLVNHETGDIIFDKKNLEFPKFYSAFPECTRRVMYLPKNTIKQEYSTSISK